MINYGKQTIGSEDIKSVVDTLGSDWLTQGPKIAEFESVLADYCNARYAVVVSNGTAALHLANMVTGLGAGDGVVTTPNTFVATSNSVIYCGGRPIFADIDGESLNLDPDEISKTISCESGIKGIIPVHFAGVVADMERIHSIAREHDLWVIEDACHALGGRWIDSKGESHRIGDCSYSDMTVFSFHPVKQITTGEGGAILTNDEQLYHKLLQLRTHGITREQDLLEENHGSWYYEMQELGYNYRITDIQCALGMQQLRRNDAWVSRRRELVRKYDEAFANLSQVQPQAHPDSHEGFSYHLYVVRVEARRELYDYLRDQGVNTQVHYIPVHLQPYYRKNFGYQKGDFPIAEDYYDHALSLPLYPTLKDEEQELVIDEVRKFYARP